MNPHFPGTAARPYGQNELLEDYLSHFIVYLPSQILTAPPGLHYQVVPTGLFPVKTGIYMTNNFNGLGRRPLGELT
jgi:hypothetical protein